MTPLACLIFNPAAGQSNPEEDLRTIWKYLEPTFRLEIVLTTEESDPNQLAKDAIAKGAEVLIASGGDGTVSAVADVVKGTGIPFGIIPRGTANAFATALGIPGDIQSACEVILAGGTRLVDAAICNGKSMILLAGIGLEAEAVHRADREAKNTLGMLAYVIAGLEKLGEMDIFRAFIEIDGHGFDLNAIAVTIANAAPPTSVLAQGPGGLIVDDGLLDMTIITSTNQFAAINAMSELLGTALMGTATEREDVIYFRGQRIKITCEPAQKLAVDGELMDSPTVIELTCIPAALKVLVPAANLA